MLDKAVEEIQIIQDDTQSTVVIDDEEFQNIVKDDAIPNGTITVEDLSDEELLDLLEDPIKDPKAYEEIIKQDVTE